jgi:hypothetical protein
LLGAEGATTTCVRSGASRVTVSLTAAQVGTISRDLAPLKSIQVPDEPVQFEGTSKPLIENVTVYRARDYRLVERGRGCPQCRDLYAADFGPSTPGAVIREVGFVSGFAGGDWQRCPAGLTCRAPEFSPPDNRNKTGCAGASTCRIWRLAGDEEDARDTVQIVYHVKEQACSNCPEGVDYVEAHRRWELARSAQQPACGVSSPNAPQRTPLGPRQ